MTENSKWQSNSENPVMENNLQYHIRCKNGDVNKYVLLPGDPDRVNIIADEWDKSRFIANNREYRTFSGFINNIPVSACSTGIGGGSSAIAIEELANLGADTFIRVGSCGAIQENINCGDLIICSGAMRQDSTSEDYIDLSYPAVANYEVVSALINACKKLNVKYHVGISCTTSSFHCGQSRPGFKNYTQSFHAKKIQDLKNAGVLNFEMEAATIFTLSGIYGLRAGAVLTVVADRNKNKFEYSSVDMSIKVANEAVKILASCDNM